MEKTTQERPDGDGTTAEPTEQAQDPETKLAITLGEAQAAIAPLVFASIEALKAIAELRARAGVAEDDARTMRHIMETDIPEVPELSEPITMEDMREFVEIQQAHIISLTRRMGMLEATFRGTLKGHLSAKNLLVSGIYIMETWLKNVHDEVRDLKASLATTPQETIPTTPTSEV